MPVDLTQLALDRLRPGLRRREIPDGAVRGLQHIVQPSGHRSWAYRYRLAGKTAKLTLGSYPALSLKNARARAREAAATVEAGDSPNAAKKSAKNAARSVERTPTQETTTIAIDTFVARHAKVRNRESVWREAERILRRELAPWQEKRLAAICPADIHEILDRKMDGGAPAAANRTLAVLRRFFRFAVERRIIEVTPCTGIGSPAPTKNRDRVLSDLELAAVWQGAAELGHPFGSIIRLLILTGQRRGEVAAMRWEDVDRDGAVWTIPEKNAKNGRKHAVHLTPVAVDVIDSCAELSAGSSVLGIGDRVPSGFSKAKVRLDRMAVLQGMPHWTFHDIRRSVATGMAALGISIPVIERVLNHSSGTFAGIVGVYQRHDYAKEQHEALRLWANHIMALQTAYELTRASPARSNSR